MFRTGTRKIKNHHKIKIEFEIDQTTENKIMKAVVASQQAGPLNLVTDYTKPSAADDEVIIQIHASAVNPVDWKQHHLGLAVPSFPWVYGCDVAGVITEVGKNVSKSFKLGDRVYTFSGIGVNGAGGFAEYIRGRPELLGKMPDWMSFEDAATLGCGLLTAYDMVATVQREAAGNDAKQSARHPTPPVLVYGASSSVGLYAVQLAKLYGHKVVAVASKKHESLLKSYGADHVIDYRENGWDKQAIKALGGTSSKAAAIDAISLPDTLTKCAEIVKACDGVVVSRTLPLPPSNEYYFDTVHMVTAFVLDAYVEGKADAYFKYATLINGLVETEKIKPNPTRVLGGLDKVSEALELFRTGAVSGEKLVIKNRE